MAQYEDKVLHELDGIKEYDNPMPGWLMAIWWGSLIFAAGYLIFYALNFGEGTLEAEYRSETVQSVAAAGGIIGGLAMGAWGGFKRRVHGVLLGWIVGAIFGQVVFGLG